jgi:hypothetical protein
LTGKGEGRTFLSSPEESRHYRLDAQGIAHDKCPKSPNYALHATFFNNLIIDPK